MIELRSAIVNELKKVNSRVFYQHAGSSTAFPYIVYNFLPSRMVDEGTEVFLMDVDVWDNKTDTTTIETIAQQIWSKFNRFTYLDEVIYFSAYRDNRFPPLEDDDPSIRRRKMTFEIRYLYKGGTD